MKEIAIEDIIEFFKEAGVDEIISSKPSAFVKKPKVTKNFHQQLNHNVTTLKNISNAETDSLVIAKKANSLEELKQSVLDFNGCNLKSTANKTVFSDGNSEADVMIIGEAPGASEDEAGIPFCGQSGKLLDQFFDAIELIRAKNLYIANAIFWRPPGNRKPTEKELAICRPLVEKHIALINPKLIVAAGSSALACLFPNNKDSISKIRGSLMDYNNQFLSQSVKVMPIFHPSFLLRQPSRKRSAWEDMLKINSFIN